MQRPVGIFSKENIREGRGRDKDSESRKSLGEKRDSESRSYKLFAFRFTEASYQTKYGMGEVSV